MVKVNNAQTFPTDTRSSTMLTRRRRENVRSEHNVPAIRTDTHLIQHLAEVKARQFVSKSRLTFPTASPMRPFISI